MGKAIVSTFDSSILEIFVENAISIAIEHQKPDDFPLYLLESKKMIGYNKLL